MSGPSPSTAASVSTIPIWRETLTTLPPTDLIPRRTDVVVVGAGVIGLAAALRLARSGAAVVVFDAVRPGSGATTADGGVIGWRRPRSSSGATLPDTLAVASATDWLRARLAADGISADVDAGELLGAAGFVVAEGSTATVDPARLVDGMVRAAMGRGVVVAARQPVRSIARHTTGYQVLTSTHKVAAGQVVVATGADPGPPPVPEALRRFGLGRAVGLVAAASAGQIESITGGRHLPTRHRRLMRRAPGGVLVWIADADLPRDPARLLAAAAPELAGAGVTHLWSDVHVLAPDRLAHIVRIDGLWCAGGATDLAVGAMVGDEVGAVAAGDSGSGRFTDSPPPRRWRRRT